MQHFPQILSYITEKEKEIFDFNHSPRNLYEPIEYILSLGGKKIRPALALMSFNLFSDKLDEAVYQALAIEVYHNFTLMHDDLMDKALLRRGKTVVHEKWDANTAILSGDAMLVYAYQLLEKTPANLLPDILRLFSQTAMEVFKGQQYDMEFETRLDISKEDYLMMIRLKTAVLLACALKAGAVLGNASDEDANLLYDFGINLGLSFQLKDDLLDVYGDTEKFGKNIGGDILCNKKTFLLITALENAGEKQKAELINWMQLETFDKEEKIRRFVAIYDETRAKSFCEQEIDKFYKKAIDALSQVSVMEEKKQPLLLLAESLMQREA